MNSLLKSRVLELLPRKPYCSDDKTASKIRTQQYALKERYLQLNPPHKCAWLVFDIDIPFFGLHADDFAWQYPWEKSGLPVPNYVAVTPSSGRYHMAYAISPVYTGEKARTNPLKFLAAIERTYQSLLEGADQGFAGLMTKNPLHEEWQVYFFHGGEYDLSELADAVDGKLHPKRKSAPVRGYGRNCDLFDELRYYAYANVKHAPGYDAWFNELLGRAESINATFAPPILFSEVKGIAKSVAKWTWKRRDTLYVKVRKLELDESQPLETRQALGAHYTNEVRKDKSQVLIEKAVMELKANGKKITQKAVAAQAGMHENTMKNYKKLIKSLK